MSFLTQTQPKTHNLVLMFFKNYRRAITTIRVKNYHKRLEDRHIEKDAPVREIEWFEEKDKGCLVYVQGKREPMRGLMYWDDFVAGLIWKKGIALFLKFIGGSEEFAGKKKNPLELAIILIGTIKLYPFFIKFVHFALYDNIYENTDKYSQPVREFYRAFPKEFPLEKDLFCFFSESDHAYRYREQDIMMEVDKEAFKKNPAKETQRLIDIMIAREPVESTMRAKWRVLKKLVPFAFLYLKIFKPKVLKALKKMVEDINLEEIRPSKEDLYWMNEAPSYNFRGLKSETRKLLNQ